jgi:hypothetical protein
MSGFLAPSETAHTMSRISRIPAALCDDLLLLFHSWFGFSNTACKMLSESFCFECDIESSHRFLCDTRQVAEPWEDETTSAAGAPQIAKVIY